AASTARAEAYAKYRRTRRGDRLPSRRAPWRFDRRRPSHDDPMVISEQRCSPRGGRCVAGRSSPIASWTPGYGGVEALAERTRPLPRLPALVLLGRRRAGTAQRGAEPDPVSGERGPRRARSLLRAPARPPLT